MSTTELLPLVIVHSAIILPNTNTSISANRRIAINALKYALENKSKIFIVQQKSPNIDIPKNSELYSIGTICEIVQMITFPDKTIKVIVKGLIRGSIINFQQNPDYTSVEINTIPNNYVDEQHEIDAYIRTIIQNIKVYILLNKNISAQDVVTNFENIDDINKLINLILQYLSFNNKKQQEILELTSIEEQVKLLMQFISNEIEIAKIEKKIFGTVKEQIKKRQKDMYLSEQMQAIQKELGIDKSNNELDKIEKKLSKLKMPKNTLEIMQEHLNKLQFMNLMSAEATVLMNYLHTVISLPWNKNKKINIDIKKSEKILNDNHYGLDKVKECIIEYLAVQKRTNYRLTGPILCLVGPPGVGKTSLARSIASALDAEFISVSLGGVSDESEIRGHRRTYIGAMPGKIIQQLTHVKYNNPIIILDEIDKMNSDFRGDPASALLQILDPEQNKKFSDNYLDVDYDLSKIMFICTANTLNMSPPLLDRMEIIRLSSYTEEEKIQIAKKHLIQKNLKEHELTDKDITISDDAISCIIQNYTHEAGVRNLERKIAKLCRKVSKMILDNELIPIKITAKNLDKFLGIKKFIFDKASQKNDIGITTGLAWTEIGGAILSIEAVVMGGDGKITLTGKLGEIMKESIQAAQAYVKSKTDHFGINKELLNTTDIHIHVPDGATPKDGPSAGIAMITSIVSVLTKKPVYGNVAMTGEISLRGKVLPIGGLKEKILAAIRSGIKTVIIPEENKRDLQEINDIILDKIDIRPVSTIDEALNIALVKK